MHVVQYAAPEGEGAIEYGLRAYEDVDRPIVVDPWVSKSSAVEPLNRLDREALELHVYRVIEPTIERCKPIVACDPIDPSIVLGWACAEVRGAVGVVHAVFVKSPMRRHRIATTLLCARIPWFGERVTYFTHASKQLAKLKGPWNAAFNPYLAG